MMNHKICASCKENLPVEEFYRNSRNKSGYHSWCKPCSRRIKRESIKRIQDRDPKEWTKRSGDYHRAYRSRHPEKAKRQDLEAALKRKYNLTLDQYNEKLSGQNGLCAICGKSSDIEGRRLAVDQNHDCCPGQTTCGKCVRGLLCYTCNAALGGLEKLLDKAKDYLDKWEH